MKKRLSAVRLGESGQVLLSVLAMMVLGSLMVIPVLNYASTSLKTTEMFEKNLDGLYAADAGVEDALWRLKYDTPENFPHEYQITDINGLLVDIEIDKIDTISGEPVDTGGHGEYLVTTVNITYDAGIYSYTLSASNNGTGNIFILTILIDFPPNLEYVVGSTSGYIAPPPYDVPTVIGTPDTGITLKWVIDQNDAYKISPGETAEHCFQLSGPPDIEGVEGHGFVGAHREDVGEIWVGGIAPYSIMAQAKDASESIVATVRAGVWLETQPEISCWQVNP